MDNSSFTATLLGGLLTLLGGIGGSVVLARIEGRRERQRQRSRHATAVRIVALELKGNGAAFLMRKDDGSAAASSAGYISVALDLYSLLPDDLASNIASVYTLIARYTSEKPDVPGLVKRITELSKDLQAYGEKDLGLKFSITTEPGARAAAAGSPTRHWWNRKAGK
jgi:hypothetical protein